MSDAPSQPLIAPSVLAADFTRLGEEIAAIEESGADWVHWDLMDNHFVPNLTFGPDFVADCRELTELCFDVHIMVENPATLIAPLAEAGAGQVSFHIEATDHAPRLINELKERGVSAGIVLNPQTPVGAIEHLLDRVTTVVVMTVNPGYAGQSFMSGVAEKVRQLAEKRERRGLGPEGRQPDGLPAQGFLIEVDGGVSTDNAEGLVELGADVLVTGSAFFSSRNRAELVRSLRGPDSF